MINVLTVTSLKSLGAARARFILSVRYHPTLPVRIRPEAFRLNKDANASGSQVFSRNNDISVRMKSFLALTRGGATDEQAAGGSNESPSDDTISNRGASDVLSYHLLWSPGVFQRTCISILALLALRLASLPFRNELAGLAANSTNKNPIAFLVQIVLVPFLSSACCGIQLAINAFVGAGGCAGFNKKLGPLRPYFIAILFVATATTFPTKSTAKWVQYSLLRWSVALMPEMVHLWNLHVVERVRLRDKATESNGIHATIEMTIPTMGCVACINKIDSSLRSCAPTEIVEARSWLEPSGRGGRALVRGVASTREQAEELAESLVDAVEGAGFEPCLVDSIHFENSPEESRTKG